MRKKAQAEFALILGLLVIAAIVGVYTYTSIVPTVLVPAAMTEEQKAAASYVGDFLREAATSTVSELYKNGGYLGTTPPALGTTGFSAFGERIAFWTLCGSYETPDMERDFSKGVKAYIQSKLPDSQSIGGSSVTFAKQAASVSGKVYDNKVTLAVTLPTSVDGAALPQPYVIEIPTKMGRIFDFAKNFARMQADCRVFENHLLLSLSQSNPNCRPCWIPVLGNAKKSYTFTWATLKNCMEMHIKYALSNTRMGKELPVAEDGRIQDWGLEMFPVPAVIDYSGLPEGAAVCSGASRADSKKYDDLNVQFYFGDEDGLDRGEFSAPERLSIQPKVGPFMRFMQGMKVGDYAQTYSVRYPVIVNVWDSAMKRSFKFASAVYVDNNALGECAGMPVLGAARQAEESAAYGDRCVTGATEDARITVRYADGSDVLGAMVSFMGCDLGTTGPGSAIEAKVPAAWGALTVRDAEREFTVCRSSSQLSDFTFSIPKARRFTFEFYSVLVTKSGSTYTMSGIAPADDRVEVALTRPGDSCSSPDPEVIINADDAGAYVGKADVTSLPVTEYQAGVASYEGSTTTGFANMTAYTPSGTTVRVYAPVLSGFSEADIFPINKLYESCGISLLSDADYSNKGVCSWTG